MDRRLFLAGLAGSGLLPLRAMAISGVADGGTVGPTEADMRFSDLRGDVTAMVDAGELQSVSIGVIRHGTILWAESFGLADREADVPATVDTSYGIASAGKSITATALLALVEQGRLSLEDSVADLLGQGALRNPLGGRSPVVRELLNMTAGIPHGALTYRVADRPDDRAIEEQRFLVAFPPGDAFHYSNFSIAVVDALIERVSGTAFPDFLHDTVFAPLGMEHSALGIEASPTRPAKRYFEDGQPVGDITALPRSSRQMNASLADLLRYAAFHLGTPMPGQREILSAAMRESQHFERSGLPGAHMALGWANLNLGDDRHWIISSGNDMGVQSNISLFPEDGIGVVVLINSSGYQADEFALRAADAIVPGILESAAQAAAEFESHTLVFEGSPEWTGLWEGEIAAEPGPVGLTLSFGEDGAVSARIGSDVPRQVDEATIREGLFTGATTGLLDLGEPPEGEHRIEFGLNSRAQDEITGFVVANFRSSRGKFEIPAFVRLRRLRP